MVDSPLLLLDAYHQCVAQVRVGEAVRSPAILEQFTWGVKMLLLQLLGEEKSLLGDAGATTDGANVGFLCRRSSEWVEVAGTADVDFGPKKFAYQVGLRPVTGALEARVALARSEQRSSILILGESDMIVTDVDDQGSPFPALLTGRRQVMPHWREVALYDLGPLPPGQGE